LWVKKIILFLVLLLMFTGCSKVDVTNQEDIVINQARKVINQQKNVISQLENEIELQDKTLERKEKRIDYFVGKIVEFEKHIEVFKVVDESD